MYQNYPQTDTLARINLERVMQTHNLVKQAIKEKAPELHKSLQASGQLNQYATDLSDQMRLEVNSLAMQDHQQHRWDKLDPLERAKNLNMAKALHRETVLSQMLELPQDGTSPQNPDETTPSDPTT